MGKLAISTGPCSIAVCMFTRPGTQKRRFSDYARSMVPLRYGDIETQSPDIRRSMVQAV